MAVKPADSTLSAEDGLRPKPRPAVVAPPPPANARTAEQFDTTSAADREAANVTPAAAGGEKLLGRSITTLGNPAQAGFWLETPLVSAAGSGKVVSPATGEAVLVELIPISGPDGAGSRISLAALRLLKLPLTGLHELEVYTLK